MKNRTKQIDPKYLVIRFTVEYMNKKKYYNRSVSGELRPSSGQLDARLQTLPAGTRPPDYIRVFCH
jgi:hypothetical protein